MEGKKVVSLSLGASHAACVVEGGALCLWGRGWHGQLGVGDAKSMAVPTVVELPGGAKAAAVSCGGQHTCESGPVPHSTHSKDTFSHRMLHDASSHLLSSHLSASLPVCLWLRCLLSPPLTSRISLWLRCIVHAVCCTSCAPCLLLPPVYGLGSRG